MCMQCMQLGSKASLEAIYHGTLEAPSRPLSATIGDGLDILVGITQAGRTVCNSGL